MTKSTYIDSENKKFARKFIIEKFKFERVVGLPGPDINPYIYSLEKFGAKEFELYENKSKIALAQLAKLNVKSKITLKCEDILNAVPNKPNTLYDLDFCGTVVNLQEHIKKFNENFIMTFSLRIKGGLSTTVNTFFKCRNEIVTNIYRIDNPIHHIIFETYSLLDVFESPKSSKYIVIKYKDTSHMCCFAKINN